MFNTTTSRMTSGEQNIAECVYHFSHRNKNKVGRWQGTAFIVQMIQLIPSLVVEVSHELFQQNICVKLECFFFA